MGEGVGRSPWVGDVREVGRECSVVGESRGKALEGVGRTWGP